MTNSSQTVTGTINHDAFGLTVNTTGSSTNPYKFAANSGYRDDGDAGLAHVGARYYDSQVARFITRDTYLDQKPYHYCEHDPVNHLDPSGHDDGRNKERGQLIMQGIGGAVGGWAGGTVGAPSGPGATIAIGAGAIGGAFVGNELYYLYEDWRDGKIPPPVRDWGQPFPGHEHFVDPILKGFEGFMKDIKGQLDDAWRRWGF